jgi:hypothetical protein
MIAELQWRAGSGEQLPEAFLSLAQRSRVERLAIKIE